MVVPVSYCKLLLGFFTGQTVPLASSLGSFGRIRAPEILWGYRWFHQIRGWRFFFSTSWDWWLVNTNPTPKSIPTVSIPNLQSTSLRWMSWDGANHFPTPAQAGGWQCLGAGACGGGRLLNRPQCHVHERPEPGCHLSRRFVL